MPLIKTLYRLCFALIAVSVMSSCSSLRRGQHHMVEEESLPVIATPVRQATVPTQKPQETIQPDKVTDWHAINVAALFNDKQAVQHQAALANGITPQKNASKVSSIVKEGKLQQVSSNEHFVIAQLTHSYPYLVPKAIEVIDQIGQRVQEITGTRSRIVITSLLRTEDTQRRLSRVNGNAAAFSCHYYGTTFDIAYNEVEANGNISQYQLYNALCQAVFEMRLKGRLWVKYEYGQHCLHCTVR